LANFSSGLTDWEKRILQLAAKNPGVSDCGLARKLQVAPSTVKESRLNALRKLEKAQADLAFADSLKSQGYGLGLVKKV
jgi:DNA-binding NarL/FixJ family response regulator